MSSELLIQLSLGLPLIAVVLIYLFGQVPNLREACTIGVSIALFVVTVMLAERVAAGETPTWFIGEVLAGFRIEFSICLLYTSPSPRDATLSRMPSSA